jgi:hypothetical protein
MRIGFLGKAGNGKTTAADYLCHKYNFKKYSFSQKLKEICKDIWPEQFENGNKPRELLQYVGTDMFRKYDDDVWVRYLVRKIKNENPVNAVCDDCRFCNEADALRKNGFTIVKVVNLSGENKAIGLNPNTAQHISEKEIERIEPDYTIVATSVPQLQNKLDILLKTL